MLSTCNLQIVSKSALLFEHSEIQADFFKASKLSQIV